MTAWFSIFSPQRSNNSVVPLVLPTFPPRPPVESIDANLRRTPPAACLCLSLEHDDEQGPRLPFRCAFRLFKLVWADAEGQANS